MMRHEIALLKENIIIPLISWEESICECWKLLEIAQWGPESLLASTFNQ